MKSILTLSALLLFLFSTVYLNAQITTSSQWSWMKGDSTTNTPGVYGTQSVAAATNKPGARDGSVTWTDAAGNFWLFGGSYVTSGNGYLNDLWKYTPSTNQWTWINGSSSTNQLGNYGTMGTPAAANKPGSRQGAVSWTDAAGNFWLFGGRGYGAAGNAQLLSDLWKYNPSTNQWTWVNGSNMPGASAVYGTLGIAAASNRPGGRYVCVSWADASGNLWLFGGLANDYNNEVITTLNDLWKYNPSANQWTWMNGSNEFDQPGTYGTQPGARCWSESWADAAGNFWLFGGFGHAAGSLKGQLNDLWKYNPAINQWTWINGASTIDQPGVYGTTGIPATDNQPGARSLSYSWTDPAGNFWLFGGSGYATTNSSGMLNDLWKYNPLINQWTWINGANTTGQLGTYGTMGIPASANRPGARQGGVTWTDTSGKLWLFGGNGYTSVTGSNTNPLNDLWKLGDTSSSQFPPDISINDVYRSEGNSTNSNYTFTVSLSTPAPAGGVTFDIATANSTATAGSDYVARSLTGQTIAAGNSTYTFDVLVNGDVLVEPDETFFVNLTNVTNASITDGQGLGTIVNDDFLNDPITTASQWTWMKGNNTGNAPSIYGTKGVTGAANTPGIRYGSVTWTDTEGNLWLFGGRIFITGGDAMLNDLWKYNPATNQWTWMNGDSTGNQPGIYGTLGNAAATNKPGARYLSATWTDATGNFWLFGGAGAYSSDMRFNDLWKYNPNTNEWTWINGANTINQQGVYGTQGTPALANRPGARYGSVSWTDLTGNLWLFGSASYNDLWKYDPASNQWTWMKGSNISNQAGVYGTLGTPASTNTPGVRLYSSAWTDAAGKLWLFGGLQPSGNNFNDLWKYDPATNQWTWINGANTLNQQGAYGTLGVAAAGNQPGARSAGATWIDAADNLWLLGGYGYAASTNTGWLNDLWKYDLAISKWTWINGGNTTNQAGIYGTQGIPATANRPGARAYSNSWKDASGNFWLFSGNGTSVSNDLWKLANSSVAFLSANNGNWNNPATWTGGIVPPSNAAVVIRHDVTVQANATCYSLRIEGPNGNVTIATGVQFIVLH